MVPSHVVGPQLPVDCTLVLDHIFRVGWLRELDSMPFHAPLLSTLQDNDALIQGIGGPARASRDRATAVELFFVLPISFSRNKSRF